MSRAAGVAALAGLLVLGLGSCARSSGSPRPNPPAAPRGESEPEASDKAEEGSDGSRVLEGDPLDALRAELATADVELRSLESYEFDAASTPESAAERCKRIRALAETICELSGQICQLADQYPGERRYMDACGRAEQTCEQATLASASANDGCST